MNDAFLSVVQDEERPEMLLVRSRKQEHLERLFPNRGVVTTPRRDYAFRVSVTKSEFADLMVRRIHEINYSNFKASVRGADLHDLYLSFWSLHHRYQVESGR